MFRLDGFRRTLPGEILHPGGAQSKAFYKDNHPRGQNTPT